MLAVRCPRLLELGLEAAEAEAHQPLVGDDDVHEPLDDDDDDSPSLLVLPCPPGMEAWSLGAVLGFVYTGVVPSLESLDPQQLVTLSQLAVLLELGLAEQQCALAIQTSLSMSNVITYLRLAAEQSLPALQDKCLTFIRRQYKGIMKRQGIEAELASLPPNLLVRIMRLGAGVRIFSAESAATIAPKTHLRRTTLEEDLQTLYASTRPSFGAHASPHLECDYHLVVAGRSYPVHKFVLASRSAFFRTMFTSKLDARDSTSEMEITQDPAPSHAAMLALVRFIYTNSTADITSEDVALDLLAAPSFYGFTSNERLQEACNETIQAALSVDNFGELTRAAWKGHHHDLFTNLVHGARRRALDRVAIRNKDPARAPASWASHLLSPVERWAMMTKHLVRLHRQRRFGAAQSDAQPFSGHSPAAPKKPVPLVGPPSELSLPKPHRERSSCEVYTFLEDIEDAALLRDIIRVLLDSTTPS